MNSNAKKIMHGKIVYITVKTPFDTGEEFILNEMLSLKKIGMSLVIIPRDKSHKLFHMKGESLVKDALIVPWFNIKIAKEVLKFIYKNPTSFSKIINDIAFKARNIKIALKNLIILPKSIYLSIILKDKSISHIHAHWGTTSSTMAYIISKVTGIPWSFTAHRWDIRENNLLKMKCKTASFVRVINKNGRRELTEIINDMSLTKKIAVIHMGVEMRKPNTSHHTISEIFTFLCPANFVPVKGHKYLLEAGRILLDKGMKIRCLLAGDGPLENEMRRLVLNLNLNSNVQFLGRLPHEKLLDLYERRKINAVVLPSIITEDGEKEGIPVALMEAMSYGIPVISTNTGGIPELISDGSGIIVEERHPEAIANAIERLKDDPIYYREISKKGREKVEKEFNVSAHARILLKLFEQ